MRTLIVVAALIEEGEKVFVAQREDGPWRGCWEFPGGKLEEDESPEDCLRRELREELGVEVEVGRIREVVFMPYEGFNLLLLLYPCRLKGEGPRPLKGQGVRWVSPEELFSLKMPPADEELRERIFR